MLKLVMQKLIVLVSVYWMWSAGLIAAEEPQNSDFSQPITIESGTQFVDGLNEVAVYKQNVVITQGSLKIHADEVRIDASAGEGKELFIATGTPATFEQMTLDGTFVKASANQVRYARDTKKISLNGAAEIAQNASVVTGENIMFDMLKEQLIASGTDSDSGRVKAIFQAEPTPATDDTQ